MNLNRWFLSCFTGFTEDPYSNFSYTSQLPFVHIKDTMAGKRFPNFHLVDGGLWRVMTGFYTLCVPCTHAKNWPSSAYFSKK